VNSPLVESLDRCLLATGTRTELVRALVIIPLLLIVGLVIVTWMGWGSAPHRRAVLVLGIAGGLLGLALVGALAYSFRVLQDRGPLEAAARLQASMLHDHDHPPPDVYPGVEVAAIAAGSYTEARAAVVAEVTEITRQPDGDFHLRLEDEDAFLIAEVMPEFPMEPPAVGEVVTAWGVVRYDGLHDWWELHPLIGWADGAVTQIGGAGPGSGD
jgi:hypothetical protein